MYRRYCDTRGLLKDKLSDSAFISSGFNNWKKALQQFEQHAQCNAHKESLLRIELMEQPTILSQLNTQLKKDQAAQRDLLVITLTSLQYLVRQGLPVRGVKKLRGI